MVPYGASSSVVGRSSIVPRSGFRVDFDQMENILFVHADSMTV